MEGRCNFVQEHCVLPVGGGAGVQDVLFGREQRQAVGIKVDRSRAHDGKSFQTTPAASLFTGPDGFRGLEYLLENSHGGMLKSCSQTRKVLYKRYAGSCAVDFGFKLVRPVQALRVHSVEEQTATAHTGLCAAG